MLNIILIFMLQIILVPLLTLRIIFVVKNRTGMATGFGFLEALVYVFGLSIVLSGDQNIYEMLTYALGFGVGIYLGGLIENKLAIGYSNLAVNLINLNEELVETLRSQGFGVTIFEGKGRDGIRYHLQILTARNREDEVIAIIESYEPKAFIISYEPRKFRGGYLVKGMKKSLK
ncbi:DUF2179 domain-containing protein [Bacillus shivajii]|uniref:DUF2179 domain-containing protein n=1 Tax=Bacillus shivajii TaxID=1983719 RepID=UPI001CFB701D|nr:DUF2179 domain-containing protein [Bacillus shivajii]UCZ53521.1 DUF2179 domain-containing protein [Bacillus shivajii]